jgi:hypothetical protein
MQSANGPSDIGGKAPVDFRPRRPVIRDFDHPALQEIANRISRNVWIVWCVGAILSALKSQQIHWPGWVYE